MRAAVFKEIGKPMVVETIDDPEPGAHGLVLKVHNCGICGSDLHMTEAHAIMPLAGGNVMGHEFSGEIVAIGAGPERSVQGGPARLGLPLYSMRRMRGLPARRHDLRRLPQRRRHRPWPEPRRAMPNMSASAPTGAHTLPDIVSSEEGALVEPLAVGLHAVDMAKMERGATVLVIGAGPVGLSVILWAKFLGARHVIVSERAAGRRDNAARFGATDAIDPMQPLSAQVEAIAGKAPDIIFECVGVPGMLNTIMNEAPRGCTILVAGVCQQMDQILPLTAIVKELKLQFVLGYRPPDFDFIIDMIAKDRIDVAHMISDRVTLDELPAAFEALRQPTTQCKVMLGF